LREYFELMFLMKKYYNWSVEEQENMVPFERMIYVTLANSDLQEQVKERQKNLTKMGYQFE